jgi:hypothetical protein
MKGVLTHFLRVQSRAAKTIAASVCILCIDKLLKQRERKLERFEHMKLTVSFTTNVF